MTIVISVANGRRSPSVSARPWRATASGSSPSGVAWIDRGFSQNLSAMNSMKSPSSSSPGAIPAMKSLAIDVWVNVP